jgi:hydrogenase nickel incorporation protein HypA/HybF
VHELSLSGAIVDTVVRHADGRPVRVINLKVGQLRQVVGESLEFYFEFVSRGTVCEGARLELELVPAVLVCQACRRRWGIEVPIFRCPSCGGGQVAVHSGEEFQVESIEVEEVQCTAPR